MQVKLSKVTIIMPREEVSDAINKVSKLEWFHPIKQDSRYTNPDIADLLLKAQKVFQSIDEVVRTLSISNIGILETMFKGTPKFDTKFNIDSIEELVDEIEAKSKPIIEEIKTLIQEYDTTRKELEQQSIVLNALKIVSNLKLRLDKLASLRYFYAAMFIVRSKDLEEIVRSLEDVYTINIQLNEDKVALFTIGLKEDSERINKVLRSFDAQMFIIPSDLPPIPSEAYSLVEKRVKELEIKKQRLEESIEKIKINTRTKLISLHEASRVAKEILESMYKPGGTKYFAVIQGYIPNYMESKFRELTSKWITIIEDPINDHDIPTLLSNPPYIKTFEVITQEQGIPNNKEIDPTPIIAFVWPIFYGLMFGDLGHGILLFLLGMLFRVRGVGNIKRWGTLVAASGIGATITGLGTGEFFGYHIEELALLNTILKPLIDAHLIGIISVSKLTFEEIARILEISIAIGVAHIITAFILKITKDLRENKKVEAGMIDIPTLIMYGAVVSLILAAVGANYDVIGMFGITGKVHNEPVPWLTPILGKWVTVELVAKAAVPIIFACMATIIIGHTIEEKRLKEKGIHEEGAGLIGIVMEVTIIKFIEMLSNTISYSRIAIMLLVHVILLFIVNNGFEMLMTNSNVGGAIAMIVGGNIGIMLIEGIIVYIQALRLHLYEWFPKWYIGDGKSFKKIIPNMLYSSISWKSK